MTKFQLRLRQFVEAKLTREFGKFALIKIGLTAISHGTAFLWSLAYPAAVDQVTFANSVLTQLTEYFLLPKYVFIESDKDRPATWWQFVKFWIVVVALGQLEGHLMKHYLGLANPFHVAYFYAHIPTFPLRFVLDRFWVYRKSSPRSHA